MLMPHERYRSPHYLLIENPNAWHHHSTEARSTGVRAELLHPGHTVDTISHPVRPEDISSIDIADTLVHLEGGDGLVNRAVSALAGVVEDDPDTTADLYDIHRRMLGQAGDMAIYAGAGGGANNVPLSAHGRFAIRPELLGKAREISKAQYRPILYRITGEQGETKHLGLTTSCFGLGGSAIAAAALEAAKPELKQMREIAALGRQALLVLKAISQAPSFSGILGGEQIDPRRLNGLAAAEWVYSKIHAKQGRTGVNLDDTKLQPILLVKSHHPTLHTVGGLLRTRFNRHVNPPLDMDQTNLTFRLTSEEPVPYHTDGEAGPEKLLFPGDTLELALGRLAVPLLMVR